MTSEDTQSLDTATNTPIAYPPLKARLEPFRQLLASARQCRERLRQVLKPIIAPITYPTCRPRGQRGSSSFPCGPGYLVNLLKKAGYTNVKGVDSDPAKIEYAKAKGLNCSVSLAFDCLLQETGLFDVIIPEQELNHLTLDEQIAFLELCRERLKPGGLLIVYGLNGANPLVGSENLAHNIDHFNTFTDYSLKQILELSGFSGIKTMPLKLYVFWKNPLNYVGLAVTSVLELFFRACFILYGKDVKVLSKKLAAVARAPGRPGE